MQSSEESHKSHKSDHHGKTETSETKMSSCCHNNEPCHKEEESISPDHTHKHDEKESHEGDCCAHEHSHDEHKHDEKESHGDDCCAHDHSHDEDAHKVDHHEHSHDQDAHKVDHHEHSHDHDADCSHCGPKVVSAEDVADVEVPEWKKKALAAGGDASAAPFGMSWNTEGTVSATEASAKSHDHDHGHS